jgi:bifunctional NMN adenylyltransferase/nudix hydrolase
MTYKYDVLVFIGRFQPFHKGHALVIDTALNLAKNVIVLAGSSNRARDARNPFTFAERAQMIRDHYYNSKSSLQLRAEQGLHISPLDDIMYNDEAWIESVQKKVTIAVLNVVNGYPADYTSSYSNFNAGTNDVKIGLIGCNKDHTSYYLKLFPTWGSEGVEFLDPINATDIRDTFFDTGIITANDLPNSTIVFLMKFAKSDTYTVLRTARIWHVNYKRNVQKYPRIEHTVDSVVVQSGHVLLIQRRAEPGKGLWAMPGGFLNVDERMLDGALRELREETKLAVPEPVLRGSLVTSKTYDDPKRSERGRLITQAYLFSLTKTEKLPKIKGSDDAAKAKWVPISELRPIEMFEDHYFIIKDLLGKL